VRVASVAWLVLAALAAAAAALTGGGAQVAGALAGVALVAGVTLFGALSVGLAAAYAPRASMLVALSTYALQVTLLAVVFVAVSRSGAAGRTLDVRWLASTVILGTLCWVGSLVTVSMRGVRG
jgi:ATP synthase protein I